MKIKHLVAPGAALVLAAALGACGSAATAAPPSQANAASTSGDLQVSVVFPAYGSSSAPGGTIPVGGACNVGTYNVTLTDQNNTVLGQQTIAGTNGATVQPYASDTACVSTVDFGHIGNKSQYGVTITNPGQAPANTIYFSQADRQSNGGILGLTYSGE